MGRPKNFEREEVLEKALPLFWKRGFADTGLQDLEKATGVNKSGLYSEFKNKGDLFTATLLHYLRTHKGAQLLSAEPLGWKNIENFFDYALTNKNGCFGVNSIRDLAILTKEANSVMTKARASLKRALAKNIAAEQTQIAAETLAGIFVLLFSGIALEHNLKSGKALPPDKIKEFIKLIREL